MRNVFHQRDLDHFYRSLLWWSFPWLDLNHKKIALSLCFLCSMDYIKVWLNIFFIFTMLQRLGTQEKLVELLQIVFWKAFHSHHCVSVNIFSLDKLFKTSKKQSLKNFCSLVTSLWPSAERDEWENVPVFHASRISLCSLQECCNWEFSICFASYVGHCSYYNLKGRRFWCWGAFRNSSGRV